LPVGESTPPFPRTCQFPSWHRQVSSASGVTYLSGISVPGRTPPSLDMRTSSRVSTLTQYTRIGALPSLTIWIGRLLLRRVLGAAAATLTTAAGGNPGKQDKSGASFSVPRASASARRRDHPGVRGIISAKEKSGAGTTAIAAAAKREERNARRSAARRRGGRTAEKAHGGHQRHSQGTRS
jgi:hypothetical protein